jgi:hypothetical protein
MRNLHNAGTTLGCAGLSAWFRGEVSVLAMTKPASSKSPRPWTHRQDVFFRKFQGTHAHSRYGPAGHRDNDETQRADSPRIIGNRARRTNSAGHGQSGNRGRRARLPALSNCRSSERRRSHHSRRSFEQVITLRPTILMVGPSVEMFLMSIHGASPNHKLRGAAPVWRHVPDWKPFSVTLWIGLMLDGGLLLSA